MNIIERLNGTDIIGNVPDLLNLHHSNPVGITPSALLIFIFIVSMVMSFVNFRIRRRGKSQEYPILYSLFAVVMISLYYYCFMDNLPEVNGSACIGWFCHPEAVGGWCVAIVGLLMLVCETYCLLTAVMQITAQISVRAGLSEGKKWKEWKWGVVVALASILIMVCTYFAKPVYTGWAIVFGQICIMLFCLVKIILDCVRPKNAWGILIGIIFFIGIEAVTILSIECVYGAVLFFVIIIGMLGSAKASKKTPKQKA